jgi:hypothetical protein
MQLSIQDLKEVLKVRTANLTGKKSAEDASGIMAGIKDIRSALDEMQTYAEQLALEQEKEREELEKKLG